MAKSKRNQHKTAGNRHEKGKKKGAGKRKAKLGPLLKPKKDSKFSWTKNLPVGPE
jgi:hypothetical protein